MIPDAGKTPARYSTRRLTESQYERAKKSGNETRSRVNCMPIRYFICTAIIEALAATPVAISGMGHAGPKGGILAWISFFLNLPGILFVDWLFPNWDLPWPGFMLAVFVVQTVALWLFGLFVAWLHRARKKA